MFEKRLLLETPLYTFISFPILLLLYSRSKKWRVHARSKIKSATTGYIRSASYRIYRSVTLPVQAK